MIQVQLKVLHRQDGVLANIMCRPIIATLSLLLFRGIVRIELLGKILIYIYIYIYIYAVRAAVHEEKNERKPGQTYGW